MDYTTINIIYFQKFLYNKLLFLNHVQQCFKNYF